MMKDSFTANATIKNVEKLEEAAALVLDYKNRLKEIETEEEELVKNVREQLASKKLSQVTGVTISERIDQLTESIAAFAEKKPDEVFPDEKKTRKFDASVVTAKIGKPQVIFSDDVTRKTIIEKITKGLKIHDAIERLLKRLKLSNWIRLKVELDLDAIKKSVESGKITPRKLKTLGMEIVQTTNVNISARS